MTIITLAQVKAQLGLTATTYDAQITAKIPYIDATVKQITNNTYNLLIGGNTTEDSKTVTVYSLMLDNEFYYSEYSGINNQRVKSDVSKVLEVGQQLESDSIPTGSYITNIIDSGYDVNVSGNRYRQVDIEISEDATATATGETITLGINISFHSIIAKGIWYMIGNTSQDLTDTAWTSRNVGPLSVSRSEMDAKIDGKYGMPAWFIKAFPRFMRGF